MSGEWPFVPKLSDYTDIEGLKMSEEIGGKKNLVIPARIHADIPQEGTKHDSGKPPMALLSSVALIEIAKVLEFGAKKYAPDNWRSGFAWRRVGSAALRHLFAWLNGEDKDPETGLSHLGHAGCCIMFLLEFEANKVGTDDRYKKS